MIIHPKARTVISQLSLPTPLQKYFSNVEWEIDLSNNTNPYGGNFCEYPDVKQHALKDLYLKTILTLNPPPSPASSLGPDNLLFTAGSMEGIDLILRAFSEPKQDLIGVLSPSFSAYTHWALIHGLHLHPLPLLGDNLDQLNIKDILKLNPKIIFICNPNNPTGTKVAAEHIENLCQVWDGFVVIDEAYIEFSNQPSFVFNLNKYKNAIILRTFSKAWGLAGIRCGAILADKSIINALRFIQLPFSVPSHSQAKVEERLLFPQEIYASWEKIKTNRKEMTEELSTFKSVTKIFKSDTNFMMIVLKEFERTMNFLTQHKIHVLDCSSLLPNAIRVSLGTEKQNQQFLEVLREANV